MRSEPDANVMRWLNAQHLDALWLTAVTVAELRFGAARLAAGKRRTVLAERIEEAVSGMFAGRIADFGIEAAGFLGERAANAEARGARVEFADAAIAAIALAKGFAVATRDTDPFHTMGVDIIDPWA